MSLLSRIADAFAPPYPPVAEPAAPAPAQPEGGPPPRTPERTRMGTPSDVATILDLRAQREGRGAGWRESVDELLVLMGLAADAATKARLAAELDLEEDAEPLDSRLHRALMLRLADNGAVAPESYFK